MRTAYQFLSLVLAQSVRPRTDRTAGYAASHPSGGDYTIDCAPWAGLSFTESHAG